MRDKTRADKRRSEIDRTTEHLLSTMDEHRGAKMSEKARDRETAMRLKAEAEAEEEREREKKTMARARAIQQQYQLNQQIAEKRSNKGRDPGAAEMTDLEATLNRGLLVSMMQHSYDNMTVLN